MLLPIKPIIDRRPRRNGVCYTGAYDRASNNLQDNVL